MVREFPARNKTERKRQSARELGLYSRGYGGKGDEAREGLAAPRKLACLLVLVGGAEQGPASRAAWPNQRQARSSGPAPAHAAV